MRRLAAIAAVAVLTVGNLASCAGWQGTPEARMACCRDEAACPMHASPAGDTGSAPVLTQADADRCCAGATDRTPSSSPGLAFAINSIADLPVIAAAIGPRPAPALDTWRALVPHPVSPVPRHLLLTVLVV